MTKKSEILNKREIIGSNRCEKWILLSSQVKILLSQGDKRKSAHFSKNVGSNFMKARSGLFLEENQKICYHTLIGNIVAYFYAIKIWILWQLLAKI